MMSLEEGLAEGRGYQALPAVAFAISTIGLLRTGRRIDLAKLEIMLYMNDHLFGRDAKRGSR